MTSRNLAISRKQWELVHSPTLFKWNQCEQLYQSMTSSTRSWGKNLDRAIIRDSNRKNRSGYNKIGFGTKFSKRYALTKRKTKRSLTNTSRRSSPDKLSSKRHLPSMLRGTILTRWTRQTSWQQKERMHWRRWKETTSTTSIPAWTTSETYRKKLKTDRLKSSVKWELRVQRPIKASSMLGNTLEPEEQLEISTGHSINKNDCSKDKQWIVKLLPRCMIHQGSLEQVPRWTSRALWWINRVWWMTLKLSKDKSPSRRS